MFPSLHDAVYSEVLDDIGPTRFNGNNTDNGSNNRYSTRVMGRFTCPNDSCSTAGWGSKMVAILIRGYPGNRYNAVVFNQHCKDCNMLGILTLHEDSYVERVAYRLRVWAGVDVERPPYSPKQGPPHEREFCEGCKQGYCQVDNRPRR